MAILRLKTSLVYPDSDIVIFLQDHFDSMVDITEIPDIAERQERVWEVTDQRLSPRAKEIKVLMLKLGDPKPDIQGLRQIAHIYKMEWVFYWYRSE